MYKFGRRSESKLKECHADLIAIHYLAISWTKIDYGLSECARTIEKAREMFITGKSTLNPDAGQLSKHIVNEDGVAMASDIYIYHPDRQTRQKLQYDIPSLCYVAGVIQSAADWLLSEGKISHQIRWGGNWDMDGVILIDQNFDDLPHFELIK